MELNDFISHRILGIVFNSREEYKLLSILKGLDYDIEFMISNPFKIEDVISRIDINYIRDEKIDYILLNKDIKRKLLVLDISMISMSKNSSFDLYKELIYNLYKNNVSKIPIILLNRGYDGKNNVDSLSRISTSISTSIDNILAFSGDEFKILKSREHSYGTFKVNTTI